MKRASQPCDSVNLLHFELPLWQSGLVRVAGVDEAGRGPLAGPVVAAAVILPPNWRSPAIFDSKKLSEARRELGFRIIQENALAVGIGMVAEQEIDVINILQATLKAMQIAVAKLQPPAQFALVDGNQLPRLRLPMQAIVKGDQLSQSVAAASIIAKVTRDRLMRAYAQNFPQYGFERHKGYPTQDHIAMIRKYGLCPLHRRSFRVKI